jgi:hypothetical protein
MGADTTGKAVAINDPERLDAKTCRLCEKLLARTGAAQE